MIQNIVTKVKSNKILAVLVLLWVVFAAIIPINILSKVFVIAAGLNLYIFTLYFGNIFNIASLFMSLFLFMIGCSQAKLSPIEQDDFSSLTWITLLTVIVVFYATIFIYQKIAKKSTKPMRIKPEYKFSGRTVLLINIIFLVAELAIYYFAFKRIGGIPLFDDYLRAIEMTAYLGNWMMTVMVLPLFLIIFDTVYIVHTKKYQYFFFIIAFITLIMLLGGRINIFIPVVTALFYIIFELYYKTRKRVSLVAIGSILMVLVVVLMIVIPLVRTSIYSGSGTEYYDNIYEEEDVVEETEVVEVAAPVTLQVPAFLKPIWVNLSTELYGFDGMVNALSESGEFLYGRAFLRGTFNFVTKYFIEVPSLSIYKYEWLNVLTFMQHPYMDFGVFGVAAFVIIYAIVGMRAYYFALNKKSMFSIMFYAYYCMCTLFFVFDNHFYYSTFIVNTILLFLFSWGLSIDWIQRLGLLFRRRDTKATADKLEERDTQTSEQK